MDGRGQARGRARGRTRGRACGGSSARRSISFDLPPPEAHEEAHQNPSTSSSSQTPSLSEELQRVRSGRALDKRHLSMLTAEEKSRLLALREAKQVGRFLMPDAPPRKQKRKSSPPRIPCPLKPGTPSTPPPRVPQPWEVARATYANSSREAGTAEVGPSRTINAAEAGPSRIEGEAGTAEVGPSCTTDAVEAGRSCIEELPVINIPGPLIEASKSGEDVVGETLQLTPTSFMRKYDRLLQENMDRTLTVEMAGFPDAPSSPATPSSVVRKIVKCVPPTRQMEVTLVGFSPIATSPAITPSTSPQPSTSRQALATASTVTESTSSPQPSTSTQALATASTVTESTSSPQPFTSTQDQPLKDADIEAEISRWEQLIGEEDPGSEPDIDADEDMVAFNVISREASNFPANPEDFLAPQILADLNDNDAMDLQSLRAMTGDDTLNFEWSSDTDHFQGRKENFTGQSGPTFSIEGLSPLEIFEKFFDKDLIALIVRETNNYAHLLASAENLKQRSRLRAWKDVDEADVWLFLAILMLQSLLPQPVEYDYWYPKSPFFKIGEFKRVMPYSKFIIIKKCLHFVNNSSIENVTNRKLSKIQPVIDILNEKFSSLYLPEQNIAIDESLLLWKGRLSFAQLISNKAAKVGIKSYELCESRTGYLWKMFVYGGKQANLPTDENAESNEPEGATSKIVFELVRPLLNKGHCLVMDNFYNSPLLTRLLKKEKTDVMGTLRINREFVPESLKNKTKTAMRVGEVAFSQTHDMTVVLWRDSNVVALISTYHKIEVSGREKWGYYKYKPQVVLDYNTSMGGIDKKDQLLQAYPVERCRNIIWYKKLFRRLLNVSIHNSYIIYNHHNNLKHREFRRQLTEQILLKYGISAVPPAPPVVIKDNLGHFPVKNGKERARCKWCARRKVCSRTVWKCEGCDIDLCILNCFKEYHLAQ